MSASEDYSKVRNSLEALGRYATCNKHLRGGTPIELGWMEEIMSRLIYP